MNEKKFVVVRSATSPTHSDFRVYVSDIYGNNGFSSHIEDAMRFEEFQADTIKKALEAVETIHSEDFKERGIKVSYFIEEIQK